MPTVSVILPVFNTEKYLREAIDSILSQTFKDFELLLINDGSTDGSEKVIESYNDSRISYLKNQTNKGLIYTLNLGIEKAKGHYIARMDADDIALPERFEKQVKYLQLTKALIVATRVILIDENKNPLPEWKADAENTSPQQVRKYLLTDNCIGHPTIMGETSLFRKYHYHYNQKYSEDYDLWLRLQADDIPIHKLAEPLLLYRLLPTSATRFKKINIFLRLAKVKFKFAVNQLAEGKVNIYVLSSLAYAGIDVIKATGKEIKRLLKK